MIITIIKSITIGASFWLAYKWVFAKTNHHWASRVLLLAGIVLSIIPILYDGVNTGAVITLPAYKTAVNTLSQLQIPPAFSSSVNWVYLATIAIGALIFLFELFKLYQLFRTSVPAADKTVRYLPENYMPCSFLTWTFVPINLPSEEEATITAHELAHIQLLHTVDVLLVRILQVGLWWNPFMHLLAKDLKTVHEFQADKIANQQFDNYPYHLLGFAKWQQSVRLTSPINPLFIQLQNRITMLQPNNIKFPVLKALFLLPILAAAVFISCTKEIEPAAAEDIAIQPEYPGGNQALYSFLGKEIKYPKSAETKDDQRVVVRFVITEKGEITGTKIVSESPELFNKNALAVFEKMPNWSPGKDKSGNPITVEMHMPIVFTLN